MQGNPALPPGIEGVKMQKVYYNSMRKLIFLFPVLAASLLAVMPVASQQTSALKTSSLESHEGLTVSARPLTDPAEYKDKFHKKSPYAAGMIAVQVAFRNDSDDSIKINLERIRLNVTLSEENRQALDSLTSEEAADVILKPGGKNVTARRFPVPLGGPAQRGGPGQRRSSAFHRRGLALFRLAKPVRSPELRSSIYSGSCSSREKSRAHVLRDRFGPDCGTLELSCPAPFLLLPIVCVRRSCRLP